MEEMFSVQQIKEAALLAMKLREESWKGDGYELTKFRSIVLALKEKNLPLLLSPLLDLAFTYQNDLEEWANGSWDGTDIEELSKEELNEESQEGTEDPTP